MPVVGTLGLLMIVLEASLDLKLERRKRPLILKSVGSAVIIFSLLVLILSTLLSLLTGISFKQSILNAIPVSVISSAVAIPAASLLNNDDREFVIYESSFSDIIGIVIFDLIILSSGTVFDAIISFSINTVLTLIIAVVVTAVLAFLLHRITHHVNYIIIMTSVILVYILAKMIHLPALLLILVFGLILSNNRFLENTMVSRYVKFEKFRSDLVSFKMILGELTFLVRSFFFLIFGFYINIEGLYNPEILLYAISATAIIFLLRFLFFWIIPGATVFPLLFFAPRGLITILLFLSIPDSFRILIVNEELITLIILFTIVILTLGNIFSRKNLASKADEPDEQVMKKTEVNTQVSEPQIHYQK
jgi:NhaP-type Na+/H+ or K+/H+ antiporter